jgi:hypothetical protein
MEQPLPANHASNRQPGTTCENRGLRIRIPSTIKSQPSTFFIIQAFRRLSETGYYRRSPASIASRITTEIWRKEPPPRLRKK